LRTASAPPRSGRRSCSTVGDLYTNREAVVIDASRVTVIENPTADRLLANYRRAYV
jgi:hypothetical protein